MKTGAAIQAGLVNQNLNFSFIVMIRVPLFSLFAGSAQITGSISVHTNTPNSLYEVNGSFARYYHLFVSDKTDAGYLTKIYKYYLK